MKTQTPILDKAMNSGAVYEDGGGVYCAHTDDEEVIGIGSDKKLVEAYLATYQNPATGYLRSTAPAEEAGVAATFAAYEKHPGATEWRALKRAMLKHQMASQDAPPPAEDELADIEKEYGDPPIDQDVPNAFVRFTNALHKVTISGSFRDITALTGALEEVTAILDKDRED